MAAANSKRNNLRIILREKDYPMFSDEELDFYLDKNGGDLDATAYECLIIKAENTTISLSGFAAADSSKYFLRLASRYRKSNSGILRSEN